MTAIRTRSGPLNRNRAAARPGLHNSSHQRATFRWKVARARLHGWKLMPPTTTSVVGYTPLAWTVRLAPVV